MKIIADNPITQPEDDALERLNTVSSFAKQILNLDSSEGLVVGVLGPWGSGKTSFFALDERKKEDNEDGGVLYVAELNESHMKYYDSDAVSILANLAKLPQQGEGNSSPPEKSKQALWQEALIFYDDRQSYNVDKLLPSKAFLLHDIKEEKSYFEDLIDPKDLFRIVAVKPKLTSQRLQGQKGAFLLFGLNKQNADQSIQLIESESRLNTDTATHPLLSLAKIKLSIDITKEQLKRIGITKPFIYPELDKVSEYWSDLAKND